MITKPKVQKRRVQKWLVDLRGGTSTTNVLDKMPVPWADAILDRASFEADEEPLLANYRSTSEWCLLTTKHLVWLHGDVLHALPWKSIIGAQQPPALAAQIIRQELGKHEIEVLEVFDAEDRKYLLHIEPGAAYYTIWSAILAFCNYTRRPDPIPLHPSVSR